MALLRAVADLLFPPICQVYRKSGEFPLCRGCQNQFRLIIPPVCQKCGRPLRGPPDLAFTCIPCRQRRLHFACARAAGVYDGPLREAIHALKFQGRRALAAPLGALMVGVVWSEPMLRRAKVVVPVPLHAKRFRERGFNQAEVLALEVGRTLRLPVLTTAMRRLVATEAQSTLRLDDRRANVRGAFRAAAEVPPERMLLVDDVIATGSRRQNAPGNY